jgi:hypothetical protein
MPSRLKIAGIDGAVGRTPEYRAWINMKSRCYNENVPMFRHHGGRGIRVCDRWIDSFAAFYEDMGPRPSSAHSLDRYPDNNGNYEPANCRWATQKQQMGNTRRNRFVGETILTDAIQASGLKYSTVATRLMRGWPMDAALSRRLQKGVKYAP